MTKNQIASEMGIPVGVFDGVRYLRLTHYIGDIAANADYLSPIHIATEKLKLVGGFFCADAESGTNACNVQLKHATDAATDATAAANLTAGTKQAVTAIAAYTNADAVIAAEAPIFVTVMGGDNSTMTGVVVVYVFEKLSATQSVL